MDILELLDNNVTFWTWLILATIFLALEFTVPGVVFLWFGAFLVNCYLRCSGIVNVVTLCLNRSLNRSHPRTASTTATPPLAIHAKE